MVLAALSLASYTLWRQRWGRWTCAIGTPDVALAQQLAPSLLLESGVTAVELRDAQGTAITVWRPAEGHVAIVSDPRH